MPWRSVLFPKTQTQGTEVDSPPPSLDHTLDTHAPIIPPTYVYTQRQVPKPAANRRYFGLPADNEDAAYWRKNSVRSLGVSDWQDAPDPVRQSNFVAAGNKIHPFGGTITPLHTALWKDLIMQDTFMVGKIVGFWRPQMYAGRQLPSVTRRNIKEAQATTFGSQYVISGNPPVGNILLASGLSANGTDGDPYS